MESTAMSTADGGIAGYVRRHTTTTVGVLAALVVVVVVLLIVVIVMAVKKKGEHHTQPTLGGGNGVFARGSHSPFGMHSNWQYGSILSGAGMDTTPLTLTQAGIVDRRLLPQSADYQAYPPKDQKEFMTGGPSPAASCNAKWNDEALYEASAQVQLENFDHSHDHDASKFQDVVDNAAFTGGTGMSEERLAHFLGNHGGA